MLLFTLIVMRMSGMIMLNPFFGSSRVPSRVKAALILALSAMLYVWEAGTLSYEPGTLLEYGVMLIKELAMGCVLGFGMELMVLVIRFASAIIDFSMGLSMAQIYDPGSNTQMTVTSGVTYAFLVLLFFGVDGHLRLMQIFFGSAKIVPFGHVTLGPELAEMILYMFRQNVTLAVQLAFPIIAMELVTEVAVGIMMRMIPQINVFSVNFQVKIIVGMLMLLFLLGPIGGQLEEMIEGLFPALESLLRQMQ